MHYHCAITTYYDVLSQLLHTLLEYKIQHTTYLWSRGLLSRLLRSVFVLLHPLTTQTALLPLVATPRTITLPFLILADKLVLYGSQHHLLLFTDSSSPCGLVSQCPFPYTCFIVTSTGLISERYLAVVSRLV